jgi:hypothetical protein
MERRAANILMLLLLAAVARADDAGDIVRRSLDRDLLNFERLKNYTYQERIEEREYDGKGKLKKTDIETSEILILGGRPYARQIARNDKPLSEKDARKEQEKVDKELAKRQNESSAEKAQHEKARAEQRKFMHEFTEAFNFRILAEENVSGKPAWKIEAEPKPGYRPQDSKAKIFLKVRGKVWIDQADYQWVKAEGEATGTLSFALGMFRIASGGSLSFEQTRVNDEVWLPTRIKIRGDARLAYLKNVHGEVDITYRDYKKFQTDSRIVTVEDR